MPRSMSIFESMPRFSFRASLVVLVALLGLGPVAALPGADARDRERPAGVVAERDAVRAVPAGSRDSLAGWYIVLLRDDAGDPGAFADARAATDTGGILISHVYRHAIRGFAARLSPQAKRALAADPRVLSIVPDTVAAPPPTWQPVEPTTRELLPEGQTMPVGVARIQAPENALFGPEGVNVDVAVIDSGVDSRHPDLNYAGGYSCVPGDFPADRDNAGHGTHVAGTIGAIDNDFGVVGVAPGARLWSVRVFGDNSGTTSQVICGIDWVTANAATIEVANMSLGGLLPKKLRGYNCVSPGYDAELIAICASVDAGVTYVVAAGNDCKDTATQSPAAYDAVITVAAMSDSDGQPGGYGIQMGTPTCAGVPEVVRDDAVAAFTNVGAAVDLWAPGVNVLSTAPENWPGSYRPYSVLSGTSMASPHAAGAAALVMAAHPRFSPAQVKQALIGQAEARQLRNAYTKLKWNAGRPEFESAFIVNVNDGPPWPWEDQSR